MQVFGAQGHIPLRHAPRKLQPLRSKFRSTTRCREAHGSWILPVDWLTRSITSLLRMHNTRGRRASSLSGNQCVRHCHHHHGAGASPRHLRQVAGQAAQFLEPEVPGLPLERSHALDLVFELAGAQVVQYVDVWQGISIDEELKVHLSQQMYHPNVVGVALFPVWPHDLPDASVLTSASSETKCVSGTVERSREEHAYLRH